MKQVSIGKMVLAVICIVGFYSCGSDSQDNRTYFPDDKKNLDGQSEELLADQNGQELSAEEREKVQSVLRPVLSG